MTRDEKIIAETLRLLNMTNSINRQEFCRLLTEQNDAKGFTPFANAVIALVEILE